MNVIGIIPARMAASRFPGKPLYPIKGRPLLEHCYCRARLFPNWTKLIVATCDTEIKKFCSSKAIPVVMTANTHTRALDRVAEAAPKCGLKLDNDDIVVCVQGDEPLLGPDVIETVLKPFSNVTVDGTMLAAPIHDEDTFNNPDIVKLVHNLKGNILYTSRSPIPYMKKFDPNGGAKRVGGIFAFRWHFLKWFAKTPESPLEISEACDSNRICDHGYFQQVASMTDRPYQSVDSPEDIVRVERALSQDSLWGSY